MPFLKHLLTSCLLAAAATSSVATGETLKRQERSKAGCDALATAAPDKVFFPDTPVYQYENGEFWSVTQLMDPACVFRPTSVEDVSQAVKSLVKAKAQFAIRGGGHMGIKVSCLSRLRRTFSLTQSSPGSK